MTTTARIEAFDARAEGLRREVEISRDRIVIARRRDGVDMRIALQPRQFRGVALGVLIAEATDLLYTVRLIHADPDLCVTLGQFENEPEARALWRRWASALRLSRLIERADGDYEIDRAQTRFPLERRRGRATHRRRNRFLARRKMGHAVAVACAAE